MFTLWGEKQPSLARNVSNASRSQRRKNLDSLHLDILRQPQRCIQTVQTMQMGP